MTLFIYLGDQELAYKVRIKPNDEAIGLAYGADANTHIGHIEIDDPTGSINLDGWQQARVVETASASPRMWTGYVGERTFRRGAARTAAARYIDADLLDANQRFALRLIVNSDGKRPVETVSQRLTWLLGSPYLSTLVKDNGEIDLNANDLSRSMDEADYRGQYSFNVLDDIVSAFSMSGLYYAYWDEAAQQVSLHMGRVVSTIGTSTLSISNVLADVNSTTVFAPYVDAVLHRDPSDVWGRIRLVWKGGVTKAAQQSTIDTYIDRGINIESTLVGYPGTADRWVQTYLDSHDVESDTITCTLLLPASKVNLIQAGQRINAKFSHLGPEGYDTYNYFRVISRNVTQPDTPDYYLVGLELAGQGFGVGNGGAGGGGGGGGGTPPVIFPSPPPTPCPDWDPDTGGTFVIAGASGYGVPIIWSDNLDASWYLNMQSNRRYFWTAVATGTNSPAATVRFSFRTTHVPFAVVGGGGGGGMRGDASLGVPGEWDAAVPWTKHGASDAGSNTYSDPPLDVLCGYSGDRCNIANAVCGSINTGQMVIGFEDTTAPHGATTLSITFTCRVYDCNGTLLTCTTPEATGPTPGQWVLGETITMAGAVGTTDWPYAAGSLRVRVDGVLITPASYTETSPAAGTFTLDWVPDTDEVVTVDYQGI